MNAIVNTANVTSFSSLMKETQASKITPTAASLLHIFIVAVDEYDTKSVDLHNAFNRRQEALDQLRKSGYRKVQSGKIIAKKPDAVPAPDELGYIIVVAEFEARFKLKNPNATDKQVKSRVAQDISSLNLWLSTGKFSTNVGRDKPVLEWQLALDKANSLEIQVKQAELDRKASEKRLKEEQEQSRKNEAAIAAQIKLAAAAKNDAEAKERADKLARLEAIQKEQMAKTIEATKLAQEAEKEATKKQAEADKASIEAQAKKDKLPKKTIPIKETKPSDVVGKTQTHDDKVSPLIKVSAEAHREAMALLQELEDNAVPTSVMIELARLIVDKYQSKV